MNIATAANPAVSSQVTPQMVESADEYVVSFSNISVNLDRASVVREGKKVTLTTAEFELLTFFLQNPERPLTRDMILESVWSYLASPNTRTVDAHVLRLRQKLEAEPENPRHFLTVHKVGYKFSPDTI